ncbi:MAG: ribD 2 [Acidobacteria bacterium]|nr:ribD 2 [Acidobacteriota bacterium]
MPIAEWAERIADYELLKTTEARAAMLEPYATERDDPPDNLSVIGNAWSRAMFGGLFYVSHSPSADLPATNLVFVQSRDGNTVTADPSSLGGGEADKHLIYEGLSRVAADAVLSGARTIHGGRLVLSTWRPELVALRAAMALPRHPIQIVATLHGVDLEDGLMFNVPTLRVIVITVPQGADAMRAGLKTRPWISLIVMDDAAGLPAAFRELRRRGIERLSCIGGRTLAHPLLDAGLVQDVYLTTGTKEGGQPGTPFYDKPLHGREVVRKRGTGSDEGVIVEHIALATLIA